MTPGFGGSPPGAGGDPVAGGSPGAGGPHHSHSPGAGGHHSAGAGGHHHSAGPLPPSSRLRVTEERFEELVDDALDTIPDALFEAMDNVVVLVEPRNEHEPSLLGLYEGVALTERDTTYSGFLPDTISIYREALLDICSSEAMLVREVAITVIHEIAHHFGIEEHTLHELGWG